ncbi:MAG: CoA transferase [Chloroflexota bacterium]
MRGPLHGVRVLDFGQYVAGPLTAMLLADQGADVVRVDPPGGPRWDTPANATWNRGKRTIRLNLKDSTDRAAVRELVATADVLIEGFRPGVMDRLGLGYSLLAASHPRLIYCSLPGFAADDPRAGLPGWEGVVAAAAATYRPPLGEPDADPAYTALQIPSHFAALQAAVAIAVALVARERTGLGQRIEMPLFDATFAAVGAHGLLVDGKPAGGRPDDSWGGLFQCADDRWVFFSGSTPRFRERFLAASGNQAWADEGLLDIPRLIANPALAAACRERLRALFRTRPALEWEELGAAALVPITVARTTAEWLATDHARHAQAVCKLLDPTLGPNLREMWQPGRAVRLTDWADEPLAPAASADTSLADLLDRPAQPASSPPLSSLSAALESVRVVDLSQVLAGPTAGRTLAEYGANVVKINNPREQGAGYRTSVHRYHTDVNRGKHSILLDLKSAAGLDTLTRLVRQADVVIQNFRLGVPDRIGVGYDQLRAIKPDLIYVSVSAFGYGGDWGARGGYEPNAQAATGMQARMGGDGPPLMQPYAINDYGTGLLGAFGAALALYHRDRTGRGQAVEAALAYTATFFQSAYAQLYDGKLWDEPSGRAVRGSRPLHRIYRASDGWLFLGAHPSQSSVLASVPGLESCAHSTGPELEAHLEQALRANPVDHWVRALTLRDIGAHALVTSLPALMTDTWVAAHGLAVTREHDNGQRITTVGPGVRLSRTPVTAGRPAVTPGADARTVLALVDQSDRLDGLITDGTVLIEDPANLIGLTGAPPRS